MQRDFDEQFLSWTSSLRAVTAQFDAWLRVALSREIAALALHHRAEFTEPVRRVSRQLAESLQDFRNRLSERTLEALGVPLPTTEIELKPQEPNSPDVRIGRIFDHDWELLSWLIPMALVRGAVRRHYRRKVEQLVSTNLSRLAAPWEQAVNTTLAVWKPIPAAASTTWL